MACMTAKRHTTRTRYYRPRLMWLLVFAFSLMGALTLTLATTARAHEVAPGIFPLLPSCHNAETQCVSAAYIQADDPLALQPLAIDPSQSLTTADPRIPDGKWLQLMPGLITAGSRHHLADEPIFDLPCTDGFVNAFSCANIDLLAHLPPDQIGGQFNNDLWGWVDPLDGTEYALVGARDGVVFLDLSTPTAPRYLGKLPSHGNVSSWRDIKVYQDHAFIVADYNRDHGLQIFELAQLRSVTNPPVVFQESAHYDQFDDAHNIAIDAVSGFAYAVGGESCKGGLHMIDIRTPTAPVAAGCYGDDGYIHDTQCVTYQGPDERFLGRELCFNSAVSEMTIVDVTDKSAPRRLGTLDYTGSAYIHQGWLTPDQQYFILNDEMDEWRNDHNTRSYLIDLAQLDAPVLIGTYTAPFTSIDHNLYITGTYVFEANYTTGLRILDGKNIPLGRLNEVAGFDTFPEHDEPTFAGAWTAYPYFPSGIVVVNTIYSGVFVLQPKLPADVIVTERTDDHAVCLPALADKPYTTTVALQSRNNYTNNISLAVLSDEVVGQTVITPSTILLDATGSAQSTLALDLSAATPGTHTFTITVNGPANVQLDAVTRQLHLATAPADAPTLIGPTAQLDKAGAVTFSWQPVEMAHRYRLEVASDADFTQVIHRGITATPAYLLRQPLAYDQEYYWRVQPINGCGEGAMAAGQFRTAKAIFLPLIGG